MNTPGYVSEPTLPAAVCPVTTAPVGICGGGFRAVPSPEVTGSLCCRQVVLNRVQRPVRASISARVPRLKYNSRSIGRS